ncbi:hypothetical protein [Bartonella rattaustraliani]|uniref:hypothetical protein n=1 Tax=Bartonella rattaustraliani TaxID=481139 RepID=UPI000381E114|nr:hypothetical protein [Bartonella rattaustraliani]
MTIRYFFIASMVASGFVLALQGSEHRANQYLSPLVVAYTVHTTDLRPLASIKSTLETWKDNLNRLQMNNRTYKDDLEDLYDLVESLLATIYEFFRSLISLCIKVFIGRS